MTSGQTSSVFCSHCGTRNEPDAYMCDRCGERVYRPNIDQSPPLGLVACGKCNAPNEAHAFYCADCGHSMESAVRISPEVAASSSRVAGPNPPSPPSPSSSLRKPEPRAEVSSREPIRPAQGLPDSTGASTENGSGVRGAKLPESLKGFNWAAFLATPIWSLFNRVWIGLVASVGLAGVLYIFRVPVVFAFLLQFPLSIYFGLKGNELAWQSKKWSSTTQFARMQRTWLIIVIVLTVLLSMLILIQGSSAGGQGDAVP